MLKRIDAAEVQLGMFIHKLEGDWLKHPFWRTKFLLTDAQILADLRASQVDGVLIDVEKGVDVGAAKAPASPAPAPSGAAPSERPWDRQATQLHAPGTKATPFDPRSTAPLSVAREMGHAKAVVARANRILSVVFEQARLGKAISRSQVEPVIEDLFASIQRNPHAFNGLMRIRRENSSLYAHGLAVSALMIALGRQIGLPDQRVKDAGLAGLLMDVGMGHLPIDVATIEDDLSDAERRIVQTHTQLGHDFLILGGGMPEEVTQVCLEHHERMDGSGYPHGLMGEQIGLFGRMAAICDVYDSITSDRPHRARMDPNAALELMLGATGQYDEALLGHFIESIGIYPIGTVVRLTNSRLALVVDQNSADYTLPRVWSFYDVAAQRVIKPEDLDLRLCKGRVEILCADNAAEYGIENFPAIREMVFNTACKALI